MADRIPETPFALISGSAGWGVRFPDELDQPGIAVVARGLVFDTPWGATDNWQLIEVAADLTPDGKPRRFQFARRQGALVVGGLCERDDGRR